MILLKRAVLLVMIPASCLWSMEDDSFFTQEKEEIDYSDLGYFSDDETIYDDSLYLKSCEEDAQEKYKIMVIEDAQFLIIKRDLINTKALLSQATKTIICQSGEPLRLKGLNYKVEELEDKLSAFYNNLFSEYQKYCDENELHNFIVDKENPFELISASSVNAESYRLPPLNFPYFSALDSNILYIIIDFSLTLKDIDFFECSRELKNRRHVCKRWYNLIKNLNLGRQKGQYNCLIKINASDILQDYDCSNAHALKNYSGARYLMFDFCFININTEVEKEESYFRFSRFICVALQNKPKLRSLEIKGPFPVAIFLNLAKDPATLRKQLEFPGFILQQEHMQCFKTLEILFLQATENNFIQINASEKEFYDKHMKPLITKKQIVLRPIKPTQTEHKT